MSRTGVITALLLRFARDRDWYRRTLRQQLQHRDLALLDYCITRNHVHLLVDTPTRTELSRWMQALEGQFAKNYNRRKHRLNAFWGDNFHATLVEGGRTALLVWCRQSKFFPWKRMCRMAGLKSGVWAGF